MKNLFIALQLLLRAVPGVNYVNKWKQQHQMVMEGKMEMFQYPAVFIEFVSTRPTNAMSMGGGDQIYMMNFKLHILSWLLDATDGDFEKNLAIYDLQDAVYKAVQKFQPGLTDLTTPVGSCIRVDFSEEYEWSHKGVTHLIQEFNAVYVDQLMEEPVNGIDSSPNPMPLEIQIIEDVIFSGEEQTEIYISEDGTEVFIPESSDNNIYYFTP